MVFKHFRRKVIVLFMVFIVSLVLLLTFCKYEHNEDTLHDKYKANMRNITMLLLKVVESTWRTPGAQLEARNLLRLTEAALAEFIVDFAPNKPNEIKMESRKRTRVKHLTVCPEKYIGTNVDYPWFEKGRELTNCSDAPPFPNVMSILLNGFDYTNKSKIVDVLSEIYATYPNLTIHLAVSETLSIPVDINQDVQQHIFGHNPRANDIWNGLVENATTDYVLVGRQIDRFQWYALLERMVRVVSELGVNAVGGSLRTPDGHWSLGCQQTRLRNYTLTYREGYHMSINSCAYCDYIPSPFVSKTSLLRDAKFKMASPDTVFHDYFLRLKKDRKLVMSCPDAMFFVLADNNNASLQHNQWIPLTQQYKINHVNLADGRHLSFSCSEAKTSFSWTGGVIVPVCAVETLLKGLIDVMDICRKIRIFCLLDGGTTLGALKFNGILPWERDGDISYMPSKNITFWQHRKEFAKLGYTLSFKYPGECREFPINNSRCLHFDVVIPHWRIELWGSIPPRITRFLRQNKIESTKLFFGGRWMNAPTNPALRARSRYGYELLKHTEHWSTLGYATSWVAYHGGNYTECPRPGSHVCLDQQYPVDGNMNFINR